MEEESGLIWYHALLLLHRQIDSTESVSKQNASEKHKAIHSHFRLNCFVFIWVSHTEKEILNCIPWYDGKVQKHTKYFDYQILSFIWLLFKYPLNRFRGFFSLSNIYIKLFYQGRSIFNLGSIDSSWHLHRDDPVFKSKQEVGGLPALITNPIESYREQHDPKFIRLIIFHCIVTWSICGNVANKCYITGDAKWDDKYKKSKLGTVVNSSQNHWEQNDKDRGCDVHRNLHKDK